MAQRAASRAGFTTRRMDPSQGPRVAVGKATRRFAMALLKLAALGALGYVAYKFYDSRKSDSPAAFAAGQPGDENFAKVRDAGPQAMADKPKRTWEKVDEEADQSFPASDPPSNY
jgi:uncharacterized membrane protein YebE (DUF533 family)